MRSLSTLEVFSSAVWPLQCTVLPVPWSAGTSTTSSHISLGFWFGEFTVGGSSNISLLIDTGSGDVVLNPGIYVPGKASQTLNITFENSYGSTESNGTGSSTVKGALYRDEMSFGSLTSQQDFGSITRSGKSPIQGSGIVSFSGPIFGQFPTNSLSFFQTLCTQKKVSQCRFGLVLGADGMGAQVLGELDTSLYDGELNTAPILEPWVVSGDIVIDGKTIATDHIIEMDSGTANPNPKLPVLGLYYSTPPLAHPEPLV
ncbi:uncharacterized protein BP5553_09234 [Venustampulla echinocandica]|uniref:Peptidase A1 domain-containing protein n=1 Tax=Venustampulla echinocandica TaxID=2656787 RepID=A0A370TC74_9HELO|nr:uncharacterized protein BP5553_09234 [Venustampulla echinocandica]RDL31832.1 hypothetical protein BP5553_09234 [Venustampulla echinocandica]